MNNIDTSMARMCNRIMGATQNMLDTLTYTLDEMEYLAQQNPGREDVTACIEEVKTKIKAKESESWVICNRWSEHFDGITPTEDDAEKKDDDEEGDD